MIFGLILLAAIVLKIVIEIFSSDSRVDDNERLDWSHQNFHKVNRDCGDYYHGSVHLPEMTIVERDHEI